MTLIGQHQHQQGQRRPSLPVDTDVRVVTVQAREGRIADWKGGVRDWRVVTEGLEPAAGLPNGIPPS